MSTTPQLHHCPNCDKKYKHLGSLKHHFKNMHPQLKPPSKWIIKSRKKNNNNKTVSTIIGQEKYPILMHLFLIQPLYFKQCPGE